LSSLVTLWGAVCDLENLRTRLALGGRATGKKYIKLYNKYM
jgi:hypothetical protein